MYITDIYAEACFNDEAMKSHLSEETYKKLKETVDNGSPLEDDIADEVAEAMKKWAISKGATHFSHWFQPLNEMTAEKHDAFLSFDNHTFQYRCVPEQVRSLCWQEGSTTCCTIWCNRCCNLTCSVNNPRIDALLERQ